MLFNVVCWHLAFHLKISQILYKEVVDFYKLEETNHRLLLILKQETPLEEASEGAWTKLTKELKKVKL